METLGVIKPDMRIERQETLSPFGLLTQLFTEELLRRNAQAMGSYRPMQLAYLEEGEPEETGASPEIHFDLDVDLIVNKLLKKEKDSREKSEKKTPSQRILERVILREREIRTAYPETRRVVVESAGQRMTANLPLTRQAQAQAAEQRGETIRELPGTARQAGEGRSTQSTEILRPSAALASFAPAARSVSREKAGTLPVRSLTLASQAMSVPAAGGWTPRQQEVHPGYPTRQAEAQPSGVSAGSILLPDVMRRRREAALEKQNTPGLYPEGSETPDFLEDVLTWAMEGTEQTPEARRVLREVHRAVLETVRRNEAGQPFEPVPERAAGAAESDSEPLFRREAERQESSASPQAHAEGKPGPGTPASARDAAPTGERQTFLAPEPSAPEGIEAARTGAAALPSEEKAPRAEEAALYYREAAEGTAPEKLNTRLSREGQAPGESSVVSGRPEVSAIPAPVLSSEETAGITKVSPVEVLREAPETETSRIAAVPAAKQAEAAEAAALVYREEGETPPSPAAEKGERTGPAPSPAIAGTAAERVAPQTPASGAGISVPVQAQRHTAEEAPLPGTDTARPGAEPPAAALPGIGQTERIARTPAPAAPAQAEFPAALPMEGEVQATQGAELIFRNDGDINEPITATGAAGEKIHPEAPGLEKRAGRETPGEDRQRAQTPRTPRTPVTPQTPERTPQPEHAAETALPAAAPTEGETRTAEHAALIYRESAPEQAAPTGESKQEATSAPDRGAETRQEKTMRSPAAPEGERAGQMSEYSETAPAEAGRGEAPLPSSLPGEPEAQAAAPAELIYRAEADVSQTTQSEAASSQRASTAETPAAQASAPRRPETRTAQNVPESLRAPAPVPGPVPERRETTAEPSAAESAMIPNHPAETRPSVPSPQESPEARQPETVFPEEALPAALPEEGETPQFPGAPLTFREEGETLEAAQPAALPAEAGLETNTPAEPVFREEVETTQAPLPAALPAEAGMETNTPAELIYREGEDAAPAQSTGAQGQTRQRPGDGREPAPQAASPKSAGEASARRGAKAATESTRAEPSAPATTQGREAKASVPGAQHTAAGSVPPRVETPHNAASPLIPAGQAASAPETAREEISLPEAPLLPGIPAETEAAFQESAALVYREEGEEPSPPVERPGETSPVLRDGERLISHIPQQHTDEKTKSAPVAAMPLRTLTGEGQAPVALTFRREGEGASPNAVGAVARDIRLTAERGRRPLSGAARMSGQRGNRAVPGPEASPRGALPIPAAPEEEAIPAPAPVPEAEMLPEPSELVYAPTARTGDYPDGETPVRPTQKAQEDRSESLPAWAKELLEQAGVTDTAQQAAAFRGRLDGAGGSGQISWNAPQAAVPIRGGELSRPAELSFKERSQTEETPAQPRITEAELQKTADRVYRILEERLRRELRRSGR